MTTNARCHCGAPLTKDSFSKTGLQASCGGIGVLHCYCGGDFCVCHYHGETDCPGCRDCQTDPGFEPFYDSDCSELR